MMSLPVGGAGLFWLALAGAAVGAGGANPVYEMQAARARRLLPENRARVEAALKAAAQPATPLVWFAVPAMSDVMRLSDTYPEDGRLNGELRIVAAQDEFEPASFQLNAFDDRSGVTLTATPLARDGGGDPLPPGALDITVVKLWFQNGNGWHSYFADAGLKLTPELLLHDENLVQVDTESAANYARVREPGGERFVWISAPRQIETGSFNPAREAFEDTAVLQPVSLAAGAFKQFLVTVHVPKGQAAGVYRGAIAVAEGGRRLAEVPIGLRVLPFELPAPRPYFDLTREFIVSMIDGTTVAKLQERMGCDFKTAREKYRHYLVNLRNHGISHPANAWDEESIALIKEVGFSTRPVIGKCFTPAFDLNFGGRMTFDNEMTAREGARQCAEFYRRTVGHTDVLVGYGDEQGAAFVATHRNFFKYYHDYGIRMSCFGHDALLYKGGYTYGAHPMGGAPDDVGRIRPWNAIGDKYVGAYAVQHIGPENPQQVRRQHGLLGYFSNLSMVYNYGFGLGPWNDRAYELYKPMVLAYLNRGGLVDTLQWEGFREGVDDMRYATCLKLLVQEAVQSGSTERMLTGRKALQYMALLKPAEMDLDAVRGEMIEHILKLLAMRGARGASTP